MKVNYQKLQVAMATACVNSYGLCKIAGIQYGTYKRISKGNECKPATIGKIAKALNVPVTDLVDDF